MATYRARWRYIGDIIDEVRYDDDDDDDVAAHQLVAGRQCITKQS